MRQWNVNIHGRSLYRIHLVMHAAGMTTRLYLSKVLLLMLSLIFQKHVLYVFFIEMFFIPSPNLGSSKLARHEMQDIHIKAARASVNQSSIVASMSLNDDVETQKLKATFFHVLRIVMDGGSFRSSDRMSRKRSLFSVMFPDSKYTKINCGFTLFFHPLLSGTVSWCIKKLLSTQIDPFLTWTY